MFLIFGSQVKRSWCRAPDTAGLRFTDVEYNKKHTLTRVALKCFAAKSYSQTGFLWNGNLTASQRLVHMFTHMCLRNQINFSNQFLLWLIGGASQKWADSNCCCKKMPKDVPVCRPSLTFAFNHSMLLSKVTYEWGRKQTKKSDAFGMKKRVVEGSGAGVWLLLKNSRNLWQRQIN